MAKTPKRSASYRDGYTNTGPTQSEMVSKPCEICGRLFVVNNWPDSKSRTPKIFGLAVCPGCDPRHPEDYYVKEGYRILHPYRLRVIRLAQVTRALARRGCLGENDEGCKCAGHAAMKLFPGEVKVG